MTNSTENVIWAVDVGIPNRKPIAAAAAVLRTLLGKTNWEVTPTYLTSYDETAVPQAVLEKDPSLKNLPVQKALEDAVKGIKGFQVGVPAIIRTKGVYRNNDVDAFVKLAKERGADFIALTTQARTGLARFWLGSFAEKMVLHSEVPLLLVNPFLKTPKAYKSIFFPTDLSIGSEKVFQKVLDFASSLHLEVILYNRLPSYQETTGLNLKPSKSYKAMQLEVSKKRKEELEYFARGASEKGVKVKTIVSQSGESLTDDIVSRTSKLPSAVIAMSARSGAIAGALVGSVARQVIRGAKNPVWVLHELH